MKTETTIKDWICTDPDNQQYGRKLSPGVYQFKEWDRNNYCSSGTCNTPEFKQDNFDNDQYWVDETITMAHYTQEQIQNHISAYYKDLNEVKETYGDDWECIVAECIFEQESGLY